MMLKLLCGSILVVLSFGCKEYGTQIDGQPLGVFTYVSYDTPAVAGTVGVQIERGWLSLAVKEKKVSGDWTFEKTGSGQLVGFLSGDTLSINLHPQFRDHNLLLFGKLQGKQYRGEWMWVGFPGVMSRGTFEATRDND